MDENELDTAETLIPWSASIEADGCPDGGNAACMAPPSYLGASLAHWPRRSRRLAAAWNALRGIPTADLERIANASGDAARLAQLGNAIDEAYQRARGPK